MKDMVNKRNTQGWEGIETRNHGHFSAWALGQLWETLRWQTGALTRQRWAPCQTSPGQVTRSPIS